MVSSVSLSVLECHKYYGKEKNVLYGQFGPSGTSFLNYYRVVAEGWCFESPWCGSKFSEEQKKKKKKKGKYSILIKI
jgi:hypothetical protein